MLDVNFDSMLAYPNTWMVAFAIFGFWFCIWWTVIFLAWVVRILRGAGAF